MTRISVKDKTNKRCTLFLKNNLLPSTELATPAPCRNLMLFIQGTLINFYCIITQQIFEYYEFISFSADYVYEIYMCPKDAI